MKKRILSFLLALLMVASIMPMPTYAEGSTDVTITPTETPTEVPTETTPAAVSETPCGTCGQLGCTSEHLNWCSDCQKDDCGQNHCDTCGAIDCTTEHKTCDKCGTLDCTADHTNWCADCKVDNCGQNHCPTCRAIDCTKEHKACETCSVIDCTADHTNWCEICKYDNCGKDHNATEPTEPATEPVAPIDEGDEEEIHPMVGKVVAALSSAGSYYDAPGGNMYYVNNLYFADRMEIIAVDETAGTTYYQLNAAPGCSWKADSLGDVVLHDGIWMKESQVVLQVYCEDCKEYNCGIDHTQSENPCGCCDDCIGTQGCECACGACDFCEPTQDDSRLEETVTDSKGNVQTITVAGDTLPSDVKLFAADADVSEQFAEFGIPEMNKVFGLDIKLQRADDTEYQPGTKVQVKVSVDAEPDTLIGILHTHNGTTTYLGLTEVQSDGTVEFTTDKFSEFAGFTVVFRGKGSSTFMDGGTNKKLSEILESFKIKISDVTAVSDPDLSGFTITQTSNDWKVSVDKDKFTGTAVEWSILLKNGEAFILKIDVKDAYILTLYRNRSSDDPNMQTLTVSIGESFYYDISWTWKTRPGYKLKGYYTDPDYGEGTEVYRSNSLGNTTTGFWDSSNKWMYEGNVSAYAHWTPNNYTVTFNGNGNTGGTDMAAQSFVYDTAQTLKPNTYERKYTVTYDADGGTVSKTSDTATATFNGWEDHGSITYNNSTYTYDKFDAVYYAEKNNLLGTYGYDKYSLFTHWREANFPSAVGSSPGLYPDEASVNNLTTTENGIVPLYANWTLGSVTLPTPTKQGHKFLGWYSDVMLTHKVGDAGASYTPSENITLYAKWQINACTVTVDFKDNEVTASGLSDYTQNGDGKWEKTVGYGDTITMTFTAKPGYEITNVTIGSDTVAPFTGTINQAVISDTTITVTATPISYTITYNTDGGSTVNPQNYTITAGGNLAAAPTKAGYNFTGWKLETKTDGWDAGTYSAEQAFDAGKYGNITLIAQWEIKTYELTITTNNTVDPNQSYIFDIEGDALDGREIKLTIALGANDSKTIVGLPAGTYEISDQQGWSWRYTRQSKTVTITDTAPAEQEFDYAAMLEDKKFWLNGYGNEQIR